MPWSAVAERLAPPPTPGQDVFTVLGTIRPDGRPHAAPIGSLWIDGAWYVVTGPGTQKGRNLRTQSCLHLDGTPRRHGRRVQRRGPARHRPRRARAHGRRLRQHGWPAEVADDAFTAPYTAPSGGPPPWNLYRVATTTVVGVGSAADVTGATKWTFA